MNQSSQIHQLHQILSEEDGQFRIVFGRDNHDDELVLFNFTNVAEEIEKRTVKRVGRTKNVSKDMILLG